MSKMVLVRTLSILFGCLVSLLLAELGLQVSHIWIGRHSDTMFTIIEYDDTLGWKMKPNITKTIDLVDVEGIVVRSNSLGFWDKEFSPQKPSNHHRIIFLGDSFTWGLGVEESERFTNLLARNNPNRETLNFGIPGYGTDQALLVWENIASRYQPDLVVLIIYENDYADNVCLVRSGRRKPYFELKEDGQIELRDVPVNAADFWDDGIFNQIAPPYESLFPDPIQRRSRVVHWLAKNSNLVRLVYTALRSSNERVEVGERSSASTSSVVTATKVSGRSELSAREQVQVKLLEAIVEKLAKEVKVAGAYFVVAFAGQPGRLYEAQQKLFDKMGILWLDATTEKIVAGISDHGPVYYRYSKHWTPDANRVMAELLSRFIQEHHLCGSAVNGRDACFNEA